MDERQLHIHLLGGYLLTDGDTPVTTLHAPRLQALLSLLVLRRQAPQSRRELAFSLWPESAEAQALTNLRNLLHQLRHLLPRADDYLTFSGRTVQWRVSAPFTLDVASFEAAIAAGGRALERGDRIGAQASLEQAVATYVGDLLPGCYDDWAVLERERLHRRFTNSLQQLVALLEAQRDYLAALPYAQRLLQAEPLHEDAHLQLMRLYALNGDRVAALQTYQACAERLWQELKVEPGQALREAYAQLTMPGSIAPSPPMRLRLVGRRDEWARLLQAWRITTAGQATLVVLAGEAGIGKTRLAEELLHWAGQQGLATVRAQCYPGEDELTYAPVITWLRAQLADARLGHLSPIWLAEIARLLPELYEGGLELPQAGSLSEPWQRQRLLEALRRALTGAGQPLLLLLDDLQWCDRPSLAFLRYLLHEQLSARVLLLATLRPDEVDLGGGLADLLTELDARGLLRTIELTPLNTAETSELAAQVGGVQLAADQAEAVFRETEGNPLFVIELMQARGDGQRALGVCELQNDHAAELASLPTRVQAVITRRLARLSPPAHQIAGIAAAIGRLFSTPVLAHACDNLDETVVVSGLDELWRRRIIHEHPDGSYDFSHNKLREVAYQELSPAQRRRAHHKIAEALDCAHVECPGPTSAQQAWHYERAGYAEAAILAYLRSAAEALQVYAYAEALASCRRAQALLANAPTALAAGEAVPHSLIAQVEERMGDVLALMEQHSEAQAAYDQAIRSTPSDHGLARARLYRLLGNSCRAQAQFAQATHAYEAASALLGSPERDAQAAPFWHEWLELQLDRLESRLWVGIADDEPDDARPRVQLLLEQFGTPVQQARYLRCLLSQACWRHHSVVDDGLAAQAEQIVHASEATGAADLIAQTHWIAGTVRLIHGDLEPAGVHLQHAVNLAERTGQVQTLARCLGLLSLLARRQERVAECRQYAVRTLELAASYQFGDCLGMAYGDFAWLAWREGDLARALEHARQALNHWQHTPIGYPFQWTARWPLIVALIEQGRADEALAAIPGLLHPLQQQPPAAVEEALSAALAAAREGQGDTALDQLRCAVTLARGHQLL